MSRWTGLFAQPEPGWGEGLMWAEPDWRNMSKFMNLLEQTGSVSQSDWLIGFVSYKRVIFKLEFIKCCLVV